MIRSRALLFVVVAVVGYGAARFLPRLAPSAKGGTVETRPFHVVKRKAFHRASSLPEYTEAALEALAVPEADRASAQRWLGIVLEENGVPRRDYLPKSVVTSDKLVALSLSLAAFDAYQAMDSDSSRRLAVAAKTLWSQIPYNLQVDAGGQIQMVLGRVAAAESIESQNLEPASLWFDVQLAREKAWKLALSGIPYRSHAE